MKKLFNKRFALILGSTITLLVVLTVAMVFITKGNVKTFTRSGYIIASSKESSTKYYFDEGTSYKKNINSELVFEDTSGEKVNVENSNFLHYIDGGIKFLKNGVIMDLDSVNESIVPYYNITNKSLLEYSKKSYYIETIDKTLAFNNLIGRISENKYIVAGVDINLQLAGNDKEITGDYFEITFVEDGIIKVENQEVAYQTTAQDSYILVGDDVTIDLGVKKVYYNDEERMSLTQMTIDGNENIEIIPTDEDEEDTPQGGEGQPGQNQGENTVGGNGSGTGTGDGTTGDGTGDETDGEAGDGTGEGGDDITGGETGDGTGSGGGSSGNGGTGGTGGFIERRASVEIIEAKVGVNDINAKFYLNDPDKAIKLNNLVVHITNTDTGKRVYSDVVEKLPQVQINENQLEFSVSTSSLAPEANYVISINEEKNGEYDTQYFQKLFKTDGLGISLEKKYATSDSLAYEVAFEEDTLVKSVRLNINDTNYNEVLPSVIVDKENPIAVFEGLTNNTTYNIVLDNVILETIEYADTYTIYGTAQTLKKAPTISGLTSEADDTNNTFTIGVENIVDEDNSITKYHYYIYNADELNIENRDTLEPVLIISKNDASKVKIEIDGNKIKPKTSYKYKVIAEYYDNEKTVEYETALSDSFLLAERPSVEFEMDFDNSTFNKIAGNIILKDEFCTVPLKDRNCSSVTNYENNFKIVYYNKETPLQKLEIEDIMFDSETLKSYIDVNSLKANQTYVFEVYGDVDLRNGKPINQNYHIGTFEATTNGVNILTVDTWTQNETGVEDLINVTSRIISTNNNHNLANSLNYMTFNLYDGDVSDAISGGSNTKEPIATKTVSGSLKDTYYNQFFTINTLDTFEFVDTEITTEEGTTIARAIDLLKDKTGGKLQEYYTIEITDAHDEMNNQILIENNVFTFRTPALIRIEENEVSPTIHADEILNEDLITTADTNVDSECKIPEIGEEKIYDKDYNKNLSCSTKVGYKVDVNVNFNTLKKYFSDVNELIYYVCDADLNAGCTMDNAIVKRTINLKETDVTETIFYLDNGTSYDVEDKNLARGHNYVFKAKFNVSYGIIDENNTSVEVNALYPSTSVATEKKGAPKQGATYSIYIEKTNENEVYYKYSFSDIDKTLYDNKFYYSVDDGVMQTYDFSEEDFVISNLTNDSVYDLKFKRALIKTEKNIETITVGKYIFDGKYSYSADTINFENLTYEHDNRLRILILENELNSKLIDRISAYEVRLTAEGVEDYTKLYSSNALQTCMKDEVEYACIVVDYANIKDFKAKDTAVELIAYYDSGIINNDFANIKDNKVGYILQSNSIYNPDKIKGNYIYINSSNGFSANSSPVDIYHYEGNSSTKIQIKNIINGGSRSQLLTYANDSIFFKESDVSINNKLLDKVSLGTSNNKFRFNSYIPKIEVLTKGLVNGSVITIKPIGIDEDILKEEFKEEDGKYYYHIKIYEKIYDDEIEKFNFLREEKVEINPAESVLELTKYMPNTTYYFEVYAYMLKENEYKETQLFNQSSSYETSIYEFSTLAPEGIAYKTQNYASYESKSTEDAYLVRELKLEYNTNKNIGTYDVRFELYDIDDNLVYNFVKTPTITAGKDYDVTDIIKDITNDDFVFGPNYYTLKIYTLTDVYDSEEKAELLVYDSKISLNILQEPTIAVEKNEGVHDLTFTVKITDNSKVVKEGQYCAVLLNDSGKQMEGYDPICGLSVLEENKKITFENLTEDKLYIFRVYADIYANNVGVVEKEKTIESRTVLSTSTDYGVALGSVAATAGSNRDSIVLSFSSGVNIKNILMIDYSLMKSGGEELVSGTYDMNNIDDDTTNDKKFLNADNGVRLVINPSGLKVQDNISYYIVLTFYVQKLDENKEPVYDENGKPELVVLNAKNYNYSVEF